MDANALFAQANAALQAQKMDEARLLLINVVRVDPRHEQGWLALASVMDDMHRAIDCLQRVLALNPTNTTAQEWLAFAEQEIARQAAAAEHTAPVEEEVQIDEPGDAERPVPRLGRYLLDYKFITEAQLKAALLAQRHATQAGETKRLGDILVEQGALTIDKLETALADQNRSFYSQFND